MASYINVATVEARLAKDPDIRTAGSTEVANMRIAVQDDYPDKDGNWQSRAYFIDVKLWKPTDSQKEKLKKGTHILVSGKLTVEEWDGDDGNKRQKSVIVARQVSILNGASENGNGSTKAAKKPAPEPAMEQDNDLPF